MAPARPTCWRRSPSWRPAAACAAPAWTRSPAAAAPATPDRRPSWAVAATLDTPEGRLAIGTGLEPAANESSLPRRAVRIDGRPAQSQTALGLHVAAVWLTPQLDRLFLDGPGERRRFLDRLVTALHPQHAGDVAAYENALRQRARLLGRGQPRSALVHRARRTPWPATAWPWPPPAPTPSIASMPPRGWASARSRGRALAMAGEVDGWLDTMAALDAEDRLRSELAASRLRDAEAGTTSWGPHRSDLAVRHLDLDLPAAEGSTGQQKAVLVLDRAGPCPAGDAVAQPPPLLLLDEIAAHLDAERRAALFDEVVALGVQCWMTGTDAELFAPLAGRAQILRVADGSIAAA